MIAEAAAARQKTLAGRPVLAGVARGPALVTRHAINFTAAMCKPGNLLPGRKALFLDRHHELYKSYLDGVVLVFPACIGSTHTGLVLLDLVATGKGPAALLVQDADSLLVSGVALAETWYERSIPIVEVPGEALFKFIRSGDSIIVDMDGTITVDAQPGVDPRVRSGPTA